MTKELAQLCKEYCGAVAVSWYGGDYTVNADVYKRQVIDPEMMSSMPKGLTASTGIDVYKRQEWKSLWQTELT